MLFSNSCSFFKVESGFTHCDAFYKGATPLFSNHDALIHKGVNCPADGHWTDTVTFAHLGFGRELVTGAQQASCHALAEDISQLGISRFIGTAVDGSSLLQDLSFGSLRLFLRTGKGDIFHLNTSLYKGINIVCAD